MSSRAMKKLLRDSNGPTPMRDIDTPNATKNTEGEDHRDDDYEEEEEEEDDYIPKRPPARNLFTLLNEDDQDDAESEEEQEAFAPVSTSSSKKKKNKKKKKAAASTASNPFDALQDNEDDNTTAAPGAEETVTSLVADETPSAAAAKSKNKKKKKGKAVVKSMEEMSVEEFERSLQQMNQQLGSLSTGGETSRKANVTPLNQLLAVDNRFLDADAEMKKMFGARVVNSEIKDRRYAKIAKKALLAQPRGTWPVRKASGLSMEIVDQDEKEKITTFKVVHSEYYQRTQLKFLTAVASYDPNNLVALLRESPFHIDSLLQLSEVSKHNGDNSLAGEFIEQALFAFEKSFHSLFNIASGSVRLSFQEVENRSFFLALHRHIQFLGRRGCWRTAFEFNKLLLSLDPKRDELGSLLSIDFFALKAQEYVYLQKLYERLQEEHGLSQLPSFAYSIALAQFHLESAQGTAHDESSKLLQRAMILFPSAVPLLADQGSFSVDSEMSGEAAFYPAADLPKILDLYIHLFVSRNFALWKEPEVISWLKTNVKTCVQSRFGNRNDPDVQEANALLKKLTAVANSKAPVLSYSPDGSLESDSITESSATDSSDAWKFSLRVCRHVLISDFNTLARYLPEHIVNSTMHMHDPLPPTGSRNVYEERFEAQRSGGLMGGARDAAQSVLEEVVRRLRGGGGGPAAGAGVGAAGAVGAAGLADDQLRQIAEAVQMLRTRRQPAGEGALPGAFPGEAAAAAPGAVGTGAEAAEVAEAGEEEAGGALVNEPASVVQSVTALMRMLGFGARADAIDADTTDGLGDEALLSAEESRQFMENLAHQLPHEAYDSDEYDDGQEGEEGEEYSDEEQAFGPDGDDGWEPYDPAAFE
ncbi:Transcription factor 25 [Linnemannia gamsii]|uniref:Transcription factor 25 n=1 Tax=Linnemannia gamsii TaxID=64522 RepID=A0ABQ7K8Z8_9FUNG|nr:Transcription factor 25 [Linnemannia gamsii]